MKKSKLLMLLPAFLLVGCAKSLTPEEAQAVAKAINEKRAAEPVEEFSIELYSKYVGMEENEEETEKFEFSAPKVYFHTYESDDSEEHWAYAKDGKYYVVSYEKDGEEETKEYYEFGEEAKAQFESMIAYTKQAVKSEFDAYAVVDIEALKNEYAKGVDAEVKYSSKGDGQLTAEIEWSGEVEGAKGSIKAKAVYEDYKPAEMSVETESSYMGEKMEMKLSAKFGYSVSPSYPSLDSSWTKLN